MPIIYAEEDPVTQGQESGIKERRLSFKKKKKMGKITLLKIWDVEERSTTSSCLCLTDASINKAYEKEQGHGENEPELVC